MRKVIMTPNPYRDRDFVCVCQAQRILEQAGLEAHVALAPRSALGEPILL